MNRLLASGHSQWMRMWWSIDWVIVTLTFAIIALGLVNLNSAGTGDWTGLVRNQVNFVIIGSIAFVCASLIDYRVYYRIAYVLYGGGVLFVVMVRLVGTEINHAKRWLSLGPLTFQPSELMKLALVCGLARYLHDMHNTGQKGFRYLLVPGAMAILPALLIVKQPDLSTGIVLLLIGFMLVAAAELSRKTVLVVLASAFGLVIATYQYVLEGYQRQRIDVWRAPDLYPDTGGYQILQARTAVGNGGFWGQGVQLGTQNRLNFVPYKDSDFAFAVFAEEWGFVGTSLLLLLYLGLFLWAINIASNANERFGSLLCTGLGTLFFLHTVLNTGIVLEFLPNTGLPLPFVSYGGTNVVTMLTSLGMLMSISRARKWRF